MLHGVDTPTLPLKTERLTLRPYVDDDLAALHDLFGRADVCRYLMWEPMDLAATRELLGRRVKQTSIDADGDAILLAVVETSTSRMVGELMLHVTSIESGQGEIGWSLHPDVQGRGLATEGAREVLRAGFGTMRLHRIVAGADPRNDASLRVMEKLGMRREALFVEHAFVKGEWIDEVVYAILASEWEAALKA
jgi:RimJ/RimL family protein N-acetyltransferase